MRAKNENLQAQNSLKLQELEFLAALHGAKLEIPASSRAKENKKKPKSDAEFEQQFKAIGFSIVLR